MAITLDFESNNPSSNLGRTLLFVLGSFCHSRSILLWMVHGYGHFSGSVSFGDGCVENETTQSHVHSGSKVKWGLECLSLEAFLNRKSFFTPQIAYLILIGCHRKSLTKLNLLKLGVKFYFLCSNLPHFSRLLLF